MLIVGTKGRTLGGFQGLMNARNSFSKYCLQYSPIPVVVVRPDDKRLKKKEKRSQDPGRQSYAAMLAYNSGRHEADSDGSSVYEFEKGISADEEAHRVAAAIGLPARFDPTIKPYQPRDSSRRRSSPSGLSAGRTTSLSPPPMPLAAESGEDESGDDEEDEFEVEAVSNGKFNDDEDRKQTGLEEKKQRLHAMEVGEAAALLKSGKADQPEDEEEEDDSRERGTQGTQETQDTQGAGAAEGAQGDPSKS